VSATVPRGRQPFLPSDRAVKMLLANAPARR